MSTSYSHTPESSHASAIRVAVLAGIAALSIQTALASPAEAAEHPHADTTVSFTIEAGVLGITSEGTAIDGRGLAPGTLSPVVTHDILPDGTIENSVL